jgi:hypothetical protein
VHGCNDEIEELFAHLVEKQPKFIYGFKCTFEHANNKSGYVIKRAYHGFKHVFKKLRCAIAKILAGVFGFVHVIGRVNDSGEGHYKRFTSLCRPVTLYVSHLHIKHEV